jgi:drug/metabolite transporter (DMT)-like permease
VAAVLLALFSAAAYGVSDFLGGVLARRGSAWPVAVAGQASAALCTILVALFVPGDPHGRDFAWAVLAGAGTAVGSGFLYRGLASGRMGVVAPVSAVGAALVPVLVGVATGERLSWLVVLGIAAALPGIALVATVPRTDPAAASTPVTATAATTTSMRPARAFRLPAGLADGAAAGLGFGVMFVALAQVPRDAGLWPLAVLQATSVPVLIAVAVGLRAAWRPRDKASRLALLIGPLGTLATGAFLLATQYGFLSVAAILTSLYPAATILLATAVLKERIHALQGVGLGLCAVAIACVAAG